MKSADPRPPVHEIAVGTPPNGMAAAITAMMRQGHVPGLSVCVVDRDGVLLAGGYGAADRRTGTPATAATAYLWSP